MKIVRWIWKTLWKATLWFFGVSIGLVIIYKFVPVPITPLMVIRLVEQAFDSEKDMRLSKDWVSISNISKNAPQAVIAAEDQKFLDHNGFDIEAMEKAWENNKKGSQNGSFEISSME